MRKITAIPATIRTRTQNVVNDERGEGGPVSWTVTVIGVVALAGVVYLAVNGFLSGLLGGLSLGW